MRRKLTTILIVLSLVICLSSTVFGKDAASVYEWTHQKINKYIEACPKYEMPRIVFASHSKMKELAEAFGFSQLFGLYVSFTKTVYVLKSDYPSCVREATLAHEFTHYFQDMNHGWENLTWQDIRFREEEALHIEYMYLREVCGYEIPLAPFEGGN